MNRHPLIFVMLLRDAPALSLANLCLFNRGAVTCTCISTCAEAHCRTCML
jgi:hypothetical protein